jgi:RNA-binding protein NOB1
MSSEPTQPEWSDDLFANFGAAPAKPVAVVVQKPVVAKPVEVAIDTTVKPEEPSIAPARISIVIDSNVLIKQIRLRDMLGAVDDQDFNSRYEVHTIAEVLKEVKDESARLYMQTLPYELKIHESVSQEHLDRVKAFAKETGDSKSLSWVDTRVIALGVALASELGEGSRVKTAPKPLQEFKPKKFEDDYKRVEEADDDSEDESSEEEEQPKKQSRRGGNPPEGVGFDDGFTVVTKGKHGDRKDHIQPKAVIPVVIEQAPAKVQETPSEAIVESMDALVIKDDDQYATDDSIDNEEVGGEWVTPDNLHKHIGSAVTVPIHLQQEVDDGNPRYVQFVTSDYAMQNVIIQLGFKLLSLDGRRITRVKRFKLLCRACQKLNLNIEKLFCEFCGSHTLIKVSVYINHDGDITYFKNPKRMPRLRGTKYSMVKPKGGRGGDGMVLREDELLVGQKKYMVKMIEHDKKIMNT